MKCRNYKGRELLPLAVSDAARAGDTDAVAGLAVLRGLHKQTVYPDGLRRKWLSPRLLGRVYEKPSGKQTYLRHSRCELINGPSGRNSLPFPCFSRLRALSCVLERGNVFAEKSTR